MPCIITTADTASQSSLSHWHTHLATSGGLVVGRSGSKLFYQLPSESRFWRMDSLLLCDLLGIVQGLDTFHSLFHILHTSFILGTKLFVDRAFIRLFWCITRRLSSMKIIGLVVPIISKRKNNKQASRLVVSLAWRLSTLLLIGAQATSCSHQHVLTWWQHRFLRQYPKLHELQDW